MQFNLLSPPTATADFANSLAAWLNSRTAGRRAA